MSYRQNTFFIALLYFVAGIIKSDAQYITLDNYTMASPPIFYGAGVPANGVSGALAKPGTALSSDWTVGLYFVGGTIPLTDPQGTGIPIPTFSLGTGTGSTTQVAEGNAVGARGYYGSTSPFDSGPTINTTLTLEIIVYPTVYGSYENAPYRIHSAPFSMPTVSSMSPVPSFTGDYSSETLSVIPVPVPEPIVLALTALSGFSIMLFRRL
jgi:hypothetical protein